MRLPQPLRVLRSSLASLVALPLRLMEPLSLRLRRFAYECWARSQIRGAVAPGVQFVGPIIVEGEGLVDIAPETRIGRRVVLETYHGARITIGPQVTINDGVVICAYHGISIGAGTMIGEYASIRDANHGMHAEAPVREQPHVGEAVHIGRDCWIGRGVAVLRGARLANGCVVAANAVVTKPVPPGVIVGGVPARPLGERPAGETFNP